MHRLETPALVDELPGQPVEQLGVRRAATEFSKITRRLDDAATEVAVPQAVHHHARGERVIRAGNPLGQRHAAAARGPALERVQPDRRRLGVAGDDARETGLHHLAVVVELAAQLDPRHRHARLVRRPERVAQRHRLGLEPLEALFHEPVTVLKAVKEIAFVLGEQVI